MEKYNLLKTDSMTIYKLRGNGQCKCKSCGQINWTDWCYEINDNVYCDNCTKDILQESMVYEHSKADEKKVEYTDKHLHILEYQRQERQILREIATIQNDEIKLSDYYNKHFVSKGGGKEC